MSKAQFISSADVPPEQVIFAHDSYEAESNEMTRDLKRAMERYSTASSRRRNKAASIDCTDKYTNIDTGFDPLTSSRDGVDAHDAITLARKAYFNFGLLRNLIDAMTEIANTKLYIRGGSQKAKNFFYSWFKVAKINNLAEQFFREYLRSGNVFIFKLQANLRDNNIADMRDAFGNDIQIKEFPYRFIILNPESVHSDSTINYSFPTYRLILNSYQLSMFRGGNVTKMSPDARAIWESYDNTTKDLIRKGGKPYFAINPDQIVSIFYHKQDYEPFAMPMAAPVLADINAKMELKKIDMAVARTTERAMLLITNGEKMDDQGRGGVNLQMIAHLNNLVKSQSAVRTIVADYTTKAEWVIPDINKVLGSEKYKQLDNDIIIGLNAQIFSNEEKYSNTNTKAHIFIKRLEEARRIFLDFLQDEIDKISKELNFRKKPQVEFEDITIVDNVQKDRVITRLGELGLLTPEEVFRALENGKLPTIEEARKSQDEFINDQKQGRFQTVLNKSQKENGRPIGTDNTPQAGPRAMPTQSSNLETLANVIRNNVLLENKMEDRLKRKFKLKDLSVAQQEIIEEIAASIMFNESTDNWESNITKYLKAPKHIAPKYLEKIEANMKEHDLDRKSAILLTLADKEL